MGFNPFQPKSLIHPQPAAARPCLQSAQDWGDAASTPLLARTGMRMPRCTVSLVGREKPMWDLLRTGVLQNPPRFGYNYIISLF